jgi:hypothetical protein
MSKRSTWEEDEEAWGMTFSLVSGEEEVKGDSGEARRRRPPVILRRTPVRYGGFDGDEGVSSSMA